jgi:ribonuclease HII
MEFTKQNREELIELLNSTKKELDLITRVHKQMEDETNTQDQLVEIVNIVSLKFKIKAIEKSLIDNCPFNLSFEFES